MSDSISNLLSQIGNAQRNRILSIEHRKTKLIIGLLNVLQENGYIRGYRPNKSWDGSILILPKYKNQKPAIKSSVRISKPSRRVYVGVDQLAKIGELKGANSFMKGILILSTPKGVISSTLARKLNVGGEILCRVF